MLTREEDVLTAAEAWRESGRDVAIATVVETWGSAPRPVGSHLVIDGDGNFLGSVSGGCVEGAVVEEAAEVIASGAPRMLEFGVADDTAWRVGLSCGGRITVYVEKLMRLEVLRAMNAARRERRPGVMVTRLADGEQRFVEAAGFGADPLFASLESALRTGKSGTVSLDGVDYFLTVERPSPRLALIGAVHISQALAPMARVAGLDVTVIDPRAAFATPDRFPDTCIVAEWPDEALAAAPPDRYTAICLLAHDPKIDDPALVVALKADCFYIGALGSKKTHAQRLERMRA